MNAEAAVRLKKLEDENRSLMQLVAAKELDFQALKADRSITSDDVIDKLGRAVRDARRAKSHSQ
jgi:hypothetical protein